MAGAMTAAGAQPPSPARDCPLCPRLVAFRGAARAKEPAWHNAPVPSWGPLESPLLVVGLAPGLRGANRTGRPFTGDYAGRLLYATLLEFGLAEGAYAEAPEDGMRLSGCRIVNAVRCVPPANLPLPAEIRACNGFLAAEIAAMPRLAAVLALGGVAHGAVLRALGLRPSAFRFAHAAGHALRPGLMLVDSYHVSRYNTQTGRLTPAMFRDALARAVAFTGR
jgi:uracil-DNA glycosylase family 4